MDLSNYLSELYHKDIPYIKTNLGLTNTVYKAEIADTKVAIRVPNSDIAKLHDGEEEILDLIKTTDLDVPELYYDPMTHIRITKWIKATTFKECDDPLKDIKAIRLVKRLHDQCFKVKKVFDPYVMFKDFIKAIEKPLFPFCAHEEIFVLYKRLGHESILCHNDLVSGNFLFAENREYLIDYEYAGMNDPLFDLMSFISENDIFAPDHRKRIIEEYFQRAISETEAKELLLVEVMMDLLWAAWANMLYEKRKEKIYLDIFNDKIKYYQKESRKL